MSLRIWLPLTKDLRNQGLASVTSSGTPVFKNSGKLGSKSLDLNTRINFSCPALNNVSTFSVAFWAKINQDSNISGNWMDVLGLTDISISGSGGQLRWETCYTLDASTRGISAHDNTTYATVQGPSGQATVKGNWNHFCITVDPSGSGRAIEYWDGVKIGDCAANGGHLNGNFWTGETNKVNGEIQDVRIYDHALSPFEVKEISKGLILHYPLNRGGWGQENLVWNSNWNVHSTTPPESWVNWGSPPTKEIVTIDGKNWLHVISNTGRFQGYSQNWTKRNGVGELTANTKITVSFTAKLATAASIAPIGIHWCNSSGTIITQNWTTTALTTSPERYSFTYTTPADCVAFNIMVGDDTNTAHEVWITDIKLEFGEIATPWCPNSSDALATTMGLNDNIVYDTSGYGNNGEYYSYDSLGSIEYDSDSPKYNVCTFINSDNNTTNTASGTRYLYGHCGLTHPTEMTVSFWCKPLGGYNGGANQGQFCTTNIEYGNINAGYDYQDSAMNHRDGWVDMNDSSSATQCHPEITFIPNEWHHYTFTYDGQNGKSYRDGLLQNTKSFSVPKTLDSFIGVILGFSKAGGVWRSNKSYYSDFRIYTTALSAEDVKSFYQNSAYIDNQGNIYGAVYEEV